jgi:hypothetical protein
MTTRRLRSLVDGLLVAAVLGVGLGCGPIGPFSGGRLSGDPGSSNISDWSQWSDEETIQLETNPSDPHSVTTWFAAIGPAFYVPTSMILGPDKPSEREWVANVEQDPRVRIRVAGLVYEREAVKLGPGAEYDAALAALDAKYDESPSDRGSEREVWIYRMEPRGS